MIPQREPPVLSASSGSRALRRRHSHAKLVRISILTTGCGGGALTMAEEMTWHMKSGSSLQGLCAALVRKSYRNYRRRRNERGTGPV